MCTHNVFFYTLVTSESRVILYRVLCPNLRASVCLKIMFQISSSQDILQTSKIDSRYLSQQALHVASRSKITTFRALGKEKRDSNNKGDRQN